MAEIGDAVEEFKRLPPIGKFAIVGIVSLVAYLGLRAHQNLGNKHEVSNDQQLSTETPGRADNTGGFNGYPMLGGLIPVSGPPGPQGATGARGPVGPPGPISIKPPPTQPRRPVQPPPPRRRLTTHTVQHGESLHSIAAIHNVRANDLHAHNVHIVGPVPHVQAGQRMHIPDQYKHVSR